MVDIVIGATSPVKMPKPRDPIAGQNVIEAQILNVRSPRKARGQTPAGQPERRRTSALDPPRSRVMVLLVPDGGNLPKDIDSGKYTVKMRFVPHRK